jgi:metal-responsive CopG/Arc/MetJ family transcriptional regulator
MKSEVYSLRLSPTLKADLERAARRRKIRMSDVLETAAREWLDRNAVDFADDEEQKRLHAAVEQCFGTISSGHPRRSEMVSELVRESLEKKYGRRRPR